LARLSGTAEKLSGSEPPSSTLTPTEQEVPMKLLRHGPKSHPKPALLDAQGQVRDLSALLPDITPATLSPASLAALASVDVATLPVVPQGELQVPWSGMGKFICIGLNYSDHAAETGAAIPKEPIIFMKPTSAAVGWPTR
jgi:2-keto-4-pentenoate hydratase/2-oxohepta-3-ene-1,7-dioic acid hydratase in catechol pathway